MPPHVPITSSLLELIFGDPAQYHGEAFVLREPKDIWTKVGQQPTAGFNCHAYALGERIGLTPADWVEGEPTDLSMDTNPMEILLSVYFETIAILPVSEAHTLAHEQELQRGDIISFVRNRPYWGIVHGHSGRVIRVNDANWMASKLKTGRLLAIPILEALQLYPQTQRIQIYRFQKE
jgi:hypothetical protein